MNLEKRKSGRSIYILLERNDMETTRHLASLQCNTISFLKKNRKYGSFRSLLLCEGNMKANKWTHPRAAQMMGERQVGFAKYVDGEKVLKRS
jgi:hypothetical protein